MRARILSATQVSEITRWWGALPPTVRRSVRRDGGRPPAGVVARFVEAGEGSEDDANGEGVVDFYEYLVNHEIAIDDGPRYHICSAHPEARAVVAAGHIPATFRCPRGEAACPMRALLNHAPGCDVRLSLRRRTEGACT
jgi:hypothetical protein